MPVQVDGEPWIQVSTLLNFAFSSTSKLECFSLTSFFRQVRYLRSMTKRDIVEGQLHSGALLPTRKYSTKLKNILGKNALAYSASASLMNKKVLRRFRQPPGDIVVLKSALKVRSSDETDDSGQRERG